MGNQMLWCSHGWIILRFWASFSLLLSLEYLCWTSAYIDHFVYLLLYLFRLMLTTNAGHLFKIVSQEHQTKSWGDIFIDCIISVLYLPCLPRIHLHFVLLFWEIALFLLNLLLPSHTYFQEKDHANIIRDVYCAGIVENQMLNLSGHYLLGVRQMLIFHHVAPVKVHYAMNFRLVKFIVYYQSTTVHFSLQ